MRILSGNEEKEAIGYFRLAAEVAKKNARCLKSQRGVLLVRNGGIMAEGWNAPPDDYECKTCLRDSIEEKVGTEPCRSVHAEQMTISNAKKYFTDLTGSRMYHIKVKNGEIKRSGVPSCTICSKLVLQENIAEFALWHKEGVAIYTAKEFNDKSFEFLEKYKK